MRLLHTSDWHLGRSFHGEDLLTAQATYVDHLIETVEAEQVDVVVVSGDVYDRALPPVDAVALADETFHRLASSRARVVVTSGNHDSARRLGFNSRPGRPRRHPRAHRPRPRRRPGGDRRRARPVAVYGAALPRARRPGAPVEPPRAVPPRGAGARDGAWSAPTSRQRPARGRWCSRTPSWPVARRARASATSPSAGSRRCRSSLFDGIDYTALGHLHGRATLGRVGALQRVADRLLLLRGRATSRAPGWSSSAPTGSGPRRSSRRRCRARWPASRAPWRAC